MSNLFIKDALSSSESHEEDTVLREDYKDMLDSFLSVAERRLTGYSIKEIDVLAKKAKAIDSEVKKRAALTQTNEAIAKARDKLNNSKTTEDQRKEIRLQIQTLSELKNKISAYKVVDEPEERESNKKILNLDE